MYTNTNQWQSQKFYRTWVFFWLSLCCARVMKNIRVYLFFLSELRDYSVGPNIKKISIEPGRVLGIVGWCLRHRHKPLLVRMTFNQNQLCRITTQSNILLGFQSDYIIDFYIQIYYSNHFYMIISKCKPFYLTLFKIEPILQNQFNEN